MSSRQPSSAVLLPLRFASASEIEQRGGVAERRESAWQIAGYKTKQVVTLSSSLAVARGQKLQPAFASRSLQRSVSKRTVDTMYTPETKWLKEPARASAVFASKIRSADTRSNTHPAIPTAAPDCWTRQAISAEVWAPLHRSTNAGWLRPRFTPSSLERTGDRYSGIGSWPICTPGPGGVTSRALWAVA
ncbi:hypothetical protein T492DRAFT_988995 [Pavlovales sp. CCMP2436]|nr:hypothetical protein T492DRAFT_988995 [Pavlovales sp. CCMP2436]